MRQIYRVIRTILMTAITAIAGIWLLLYLLLSLPLIQNCIRSTAEAEFSKLLDTEVKIGRLDIEPFNNVIIKDLYIADQRNNPLVEVDKLGAGINLWRLITDRRLDFTHAEIIGLNGHLVQYEDGEPVNFQFIIDAFKKEEKKEKSKIDFSIRHIVIRGSRLSWHRQWMPKKSVGFDSNHVSIYDFNADVSLPLMRNDNFNIDVRRITFKESSGINIKNLTLLAHLTPQDINIEHLSVELPGTSISLPHIELHFPHPYDFKGALMRNDNHLALINNRITPSDLSALIPALQHFDFPITVSINADGNPQHVNIKNLKLDAAGLNLNLAGEFSSLLNTDNLKAAFSTLDIYLSESTINKIIATTGRIDQRVASIITSCGFLKAKLPCKYTNKEFATDATIQTGVGDIKVKGSLSLLPAKNIAVAATFATNSFNAGALLGETRLGPATLNGDAEIYLSNGGINGYANVDVSSIQFNGETWSDITANLSKDGSRIEGNINSLDPKALLSANGRIDRTTEGWWDVAMHTEINNLNTGIFRMQTLPSPYYITAIADLNGEGKDIDDALGSLNINNLNIDHINGKSLDLGKLNISIISQSESSRLATIDSRVMKGNLVTNLSIAGIANTITHLLRRALPSLMPASDTLPPWLDPSGGDGILNAEIEILPVDMLPNFFNLPIKLLDTAKITAEINEAHGLAKVNVHAPYILQGKDKIITGTRLQAILDASTDNYGFQAVTTMPVKSNKMTLSLTGSALDDIAKTNVSWTIDRKGTFKGDIALETLLSKLPGQTDPGIELNVLPSEFYVNDTCWHINPSSIRYGSNLLEINNAKVWSGHQFVEINGRSTNMASDSITLRLNDIDLDYVFGTLAINYVTFGGRATGNFYASSIFTPNPVAYTPALSVKDLSYNNAVLGDAIILSHWDNIEKQVCINADISEKKRHVATIDGGVYVTRDSLSFALDADKVNIRFLRPFMMAFTSSVDGRASGKAHLYGTFSDIDLEGRLFADTISMKVDYTNVTYHGAADSVIIDPGHIRIPQFTLYDRDGHKATLQGEVKHTFFHEPEFEFRINNARNLLCYDTNEKINPDWYGKIFGTGSAVISGRPGIVDILVDMNTNAGSTFTFVLSEQEIAADYNFLSFTDSRKEAQKVLEADTVPSVLKMFQKKIQGADIPSDFNMTLRATITPATEMIIIMDPEAGDKIKAYGEGAMQLQYSSTNDELSMHGRYTLDKGTYNFSLQDLILKTFTIRPGSYITFNGDPYQAQLGITAIYKVNANLSDLDKSFASDRDLNRTNVPVEAVLKVDGELQHPDITFDVDLPTLTEDVRRKVKSIISTDEMMNTQIIYLLALNRFYTPEYMGANSSGNELASFASTTISSHLANILGQLSNKWSFTPSIRTEAGDFSDMEVDLALSSSLLNNRLLLNGNFGYRDRSTSSTTFVGDFDLEYLLNRRGTFRLKAYNHYNDQNYYLKSALTTQGVGVVYKHDFDHWFSFLRRRNKKKAEQGTKP